MRRLLPLLITMALVATVLSAPTLAQDDPVDGRHQGQGDVGGFLSIMPPGQDGVLNAGELIDAQGGQFPEHFNDQTPLYESIVFDSGLPRDGDAGEPFLGLTDGDLDRFFKDGSFGTAADVEVIDVSDCGDVVAFRGDFGVPHIYGQTREAAQCANGYITAADRLFLMDLLRHIGRARISEFLGASDANLRMDRGQLLVAPYADEDYGLQRDLLCESADPERRLACSDGQAYIDGVNRYIGDALQDPALLPGEYAALQQLPREFIVEDILSISSLVGGIFGKGGGAEAVNSMFMAALIEEHGPDEARLIFDDLKAANDPGASLTIQDSFPYNVHPDVDDSTTALLQPGSFVGAFDQDGDAPGLPLPGVDSSPAGWPTTPPTNLGIVDGPFGPIDLRTPLTMSNAILSGADVSDGGVPIAVFGPQTGYFTPQLLVETDIHAPGLSARGVSFAGTNIYVQLGRGRDYAWSATSSSGDLVDEWALELCDPDGGEASIDSTGYVWDGACDEIPILTHSQLAKPSAGGLPDSPSPDRIAVTMEIGRIPELNDAPVVGRALTTDGTPVAIAEQRSTFKDELASAVGFQRINDPDFMTDGVASFNRAFDGIDFAFNWFYIDTEDIAYRHTCLCPIRDGSTDPDLLTWGGRGVQWTGEFLTPEQQPQSINPEEGFFANWNNKQANDFRSEDNTFKHHSTDLREHLAVRMEAAIESGIPLTRGDMVDIAMDAATVDFNGQEIYPLALEVMGAEPPADLADERLLRMHQRLDAWVAAGGHRRDVDRDGTYEHAVAIAIGDAWVRPMIEAALGEQIPLELWPEGTERHPRQGLGAAYASGRLRFLHQDLMQVLDMEVRRERSRTYCGGGDADACARALWEALAEAAALLEGEPGDEGGCGFPDAYQFGSDDLDDWVYDSGCDNIRQGAAGVVAAPPMRWMNRPTYQQVVQAGTITGRIDGRDRVETAAALSRHAFPSGASTVVIAAADGFADAVAGTPLAADNDAPLLLTERGRLSPATRHEIGRLGADEAIVLGGTAVIADAVMAELEEDGLRVRRLAGDNRFATAVAIADEIDHGGRIVIATGGDFADALGAGPFTSADGRAILLVETDGIPGVVAEGLEGITDVVIAGGEAAVSAEVADQLPGEVDRVGGANRYETALGFAERAVEAGLAADVVYAVTGEDFPDALAGAATAVRTGGVLVLLQPDALANAEPNASFIADRAGRIWFVGGEAALPSALRAEVEARTGR